MWDIFWRASVIGIGGTAAMDVWAIFRARFFGASAPNWGPVGRWFASLPKGRFFHDDIAATPAVAHESAIGWAAHYIIGMIYGGVLVAFAGRSWLMQPTFLPAWIVGIVTVGAGWFILQPGLGLGWAAAKTAHPWSVRVQNLIAHSVFALGMYGAALLVAGGV